MWKLVRVFLTTFAIVGGLLWVFASPMWEMALRLMWRPIFRSWTVWRIRMRAAHHVKEPGVGAGTAYLWALRATLGPCYDPETRRYLARMESKWSVVTKDLLRGEDAEVRHLQYQVAVCLSRIDVSGLVYVKHPTAKEVRRALGQLLRPLDLDLGLKSEIVTGVLRFIDLQFVSLGDPDVYRGGVVLQFLNKAKFAIDDEEDRRILPFLESVARAG